jgi:hypothetical protein
MIKHKIPTHYRQYDPSKGVRYENRNGRNLLFTILALIALVFILQLVCDPASAWGLGGTGVSMATMLTIGSIDDVSDRDTHGSAISYIVYLIAIDQIDRTKAFPQPDKDRIVAEVPLKSTEVPHYFEAHDIPTLTSSTEKGDITTSGTNSFVIIMGGNRDAIDNFIEEYGGGKFVIIYKHVKDTQWYILGELERPMILNNTETKDDKDGRYTTFTFKRSSVDLPLKYKADPSGTTTAAVTP